MRDQPLNQVTRDARSLADRFGTQTTEALIRAVSGARQATNDGLATARDGVEATGDQVRREIAEGVETLAAPRLSVRMAWHTGKFVGRIEGGVRVAMFGARFWWRRRQHQKAAQKA